MGQIFQITPSADGDSEEIHQRLRRYNRPFAGEQRDYCFHITVDGALAAGIVAGSSFDTLEVEFLFVEEAYRHMGLGSQLLRHAEETAKKAGVKKVLLNTYSFQAPEFYRKQGYTLLAEFPCFGPHRQFFFQKLL
ncbi:MAG: GNAT family N-acetyltransferase [Oscillospiraceae bacterium]|nr:GNAT family N-acetyltransferase [Oscillospiraceae bacterium]